MEEPAPPDAMTGILTPSATNRVSSQSKPAPVPIHRRQQDFPGAARFRFLGPGSGIASSWSSASPSEGLITVLVDAFGVDGDDDRLRAESIRNAGDEVRVG